MTDRCCIHIYHTRGSRWETEAAPNSVFLAKNTAPSSPCAGVLSPSFFYLTRPPLFALNEFPSACTSFHIRALLENWSIPSICYKYFMKREIVPSFHAGLVLFNILLQRKQVCLCILIRLILFICPPPQPWSICEVWQAVPFRNSYHTGFLSVFSLELIFRYQSCISTRYKKVPVFLLHRHKFLQRIADGLFKTLPVNEKFHLLSL